MIPDAPLTINVAAIETGKQNETIDTLAKTDYSGADSFGFEIGTVTSDSVSVRLISTSSTDISTMDDETGEIVSQTVVNASSIPFTINFDLGLLEVYDNQQACKTVRTKLEEVSQKIKTWSISLDLLDLIDYFDSGTMESSISSVRIQDYSPEPNTSGSCYLKVSDERAAQDLLSTYREDVSYIGLELSNGSSDKSVSVGAYRTGSVRVFSKVPEEGLGLKDIQQALPAVTTA